MISRHRGRNVWDMRRAILIQFTTGQYKPDDTLMTVTPTGNTTKTVFEWLTEWFPSIMEKICPKF